MANIIFFLFNIPLIFILTFRIKLLSAPKIALYTIIYPFYLWHFTSVLLFLAILIVSVFRIPFSSLSWVFHLFQDSKNPVSVEKTKEEPTNHDAGKRLFVRRGITVLIGGAFIGSTYGTIKRNDFEIIEVNLPIKNLPNSFQGYTITLLTDIHSSVFMDKEQMGLYVKAANELQSDLIVVTGDFVNSMLEEIYPFTEAFSELKASHGVYGVLGNHDFFTRRVDLLSKEVDGCGVKLLRDDAVLLHKGNQSIYLLGVDDVSTPKRAELAFENVLKETQKDIPKILMCHRPYFFEQATAKGIDVTLSGHTHGGQIVFVKLGNEVIAPARMVSPYMAGMYTKGDSKMYVSRGIGTVGIPIRINCPPEITKFTLVKA